MILDDLPVKARVIASLPVTDSNLTSTTVAEPSTGEIAWDVGTTFYEGDIVVYTDHRRYINISAGTGEIPPDNPDTWTEVGPSNSRAMFDLTTSQATVDASPLTVVITPGKAITGIALDGVIGDQVVLTEKVSGVTVWTRTVNLTTLGISDWTDDFYGNYGKERSIACYDVVSNAAGVFTISITAASGNVQCRHLVIGRKEALGACEKQPNISGQNYSTITRDFAANLNTLVPRRTVPKMKANVFMSKANVDRVTRLKEFLNANPAHYALIDDDTHGYFRSSQMVGIYKGMDIDLNDPEFAVLALEVEAI